MATEIIEVVLKTDKSEKDVNKLKKGVQGVKKEVVKTKDATKELTGKLDGATGGAIGKFKALKGSLGTVVKGFNFLKLAIIGTGIGALVIGIVAVTQAFKRSEEGQNKLAKAMSIFGAVVGNVLDLIADLGSAIIDAVTSPKKAFENFKKLLKDNIETRIKGLLNLLPSLGKAIGLVFEGKFKEAGKVAVDSLGQVTLGVDSVSEAIDKAKDSVANFIKESAEEGKKAGAISDARAKADKLNRQLIVERAKADRDRADLLEKAVDKEKFSLQERIGFLQEAGRLEEEITKKEIAVTNLRLKAQQDENALGLSKKEDKEAEAQLQAEAIQLEASRLRKAKLVTTQIIALKNQEIATNKEAQAQKETEAKTEADRKAKELKTEQDFLKTKLEALNIIEGEFKARKENEEAQSEIEKLELAEQREITRLEKIQEGVVKETDIYRKAEDEKAKIQGYYEDKITKAKETANTNEKVNDEKLKQQKLALVGDTFGAIAGILGKNSKLGKASAIAQATINTYQGITQVFKNETTLPEPFGTIQKIASAGTILASGLQAVKSIKSQKIPASSGGGGGGGGGGNAPVLSAPKLPDFNIVGSSGTNQLAEAIGGQSQTPIKAYVTSTDISSQQELDNTIKGGAEVV